MAGIIADGRDGDIWVCSCNHNMHSLRHCVQLSTSTFLLHLTGLFERFQIQNYKMCKTYFCFAAFLSLVKDNRTTEFSQW